MEDVEFKPTKKIQGRFFFMENGASEPWLFVSPFYLYLIVLV